jgi:hypothetical protein
VALHLERVAQAQVEDGGDDDHRGHAGEDDQRQDDVGPKQNDERCRDLYERDEELFRAVMGELRHVEQVVGDPPHDLPDLGVGVVGVAHLLQVVERVAPHVRLDVDPHDVPLGGHVEVRHGVNDPQHAVQRGDPHHDGDGQ